ncbi:MAG: chlorite dismutase family protein [Thermomicrobia bacterium]|nr:chlorite dismutase family protein [Thermomicrobia bacterium]
MTTTATPTTGAAPAAHTGAQTPTRRQYVRFAFYRVDPAWRRLPEEEKQRGHAEFLAVIDETTPAMLVRSYSCVGLRSDADFLLWQVSYDLDDFQTLAAKLNRTAFGRYLTTPYAYLSMTRRSQYVDPKDRDSESNRLTIEPGGRTYLFVYPFVKTRQWFALSLDERQAMMREHIEVGQGYPSVKLNTTYSFGLDDQEWVVAFESDFPQDFLDLVAALRETQASAYTLRDTPMMTCRALDIRDILPQLG